MSSALSLDFCPCASIICCASTLEVVHHIWDTQIVEIHWCFAVFGDSGPERPFLIYGVGVLHPLTWDLSMPKANIYLWPEPFSHAVQNMNVQVLFPPTLHFVALLIQKCFWSIRNNHTYLIFDNPIFHPSTPPLYWLVYNVPQYYLFQSCRLHLILRFLPWSCLLFNYHIETCPIVHFKLVSITWYPLSFLEFP